MKPFTESERDVKKYCCVYQMKLKDHIFGHIDEDYDSLKGETTFINASLLDDWYEMRNEPVEMKY